MIDHHLQRAIIYKLAFTDSLRFSELKPDTIDNKLFDYHLKKVVSAGYVTKIDDGQYALTPEGRRLGISVYDHQRNLVEKAYSVLFLIVRNQQTNDWLLYERNTHPLRGLAGFMHAVPNALEDTTETARKACLEKTGLTATFKVCGGGYFRIYKQDELESFTHFTLLASENAVGDMQNTDEFGTYFWQSIPDFGAKSMLPTSAPLSTMYQAGGPPQYLEQVIYMEG